VDRVGVFVWGQEKFVSVKLNSLMRFESK
jgi:hypothetical protein